MNRTISRLSLALFAIPLFQFSFEQDEKKNPISEKIQAFKT